MSRWQRFSISSLLFACLLAVACSGDESPPVSIATIAPTAAVVLAPTAVPGTLATPIATTTQSRPPVQNDFAPTRFNYSAEVVGSGFEEPDFITYAPDGSNRIFVLEKIGRIRLLDGSTFLDIRDRVKSPPVDNYDREQGMLGLAFHPQFRTNGYFFVHYNDKAGVHVISRMKVGINGLGDPASEKVLIRQSQAETNFNGGMLDFGADGYLYIGLGTGGTARNLQDNATDMSSILGKMLRIDVDNGDPYAIPATNPFRDRAGVRGEIWAFGLRNPWRFSFDKPTGDLYIGGPGQFRRDWINFLPGGSPAGTNFGWPILEGSICYEGTTCNRAGLSLPIIDRPAYENGNCAIIGGLVYRGTRQPGLSGAYLYSDFCSGRVWGAMRDGAGVWQITELLTTGGQVSSFGEGSDGEVYVADISGGRILHIVSRPR